MKIKINGYKKMGREEMAHNIQFTLRRSSGLAYEKHQSGYAFVGFFSGTFFAPGNLRFPYSGHKNVVNFSR
jgi:hypothetical protein